MLSLPEGFRLTYTYQMSDPFTVAEMVGIYQDNTVWYWSLAAADFQARHRVGTFQSTLSGTMQAKAAQLCQEGLRLPGYRPDAISRALQTTMTVMMDGQTQVHRWFSDAIEALPPLLYEADAFGAALLQQAATAPLAVVNLSIHPAQTPDRVLSRFENPGTNPVTFLLEPESLTLTTFQNEVADAEWQHGSEPLLGLMDTRGQLLDGLYAAATILPHTQALMTLPQPAPSSEIGSITLTAQVQGFIALHFPYTEPSEDPATPFELLYQSSTGN